MDKILYLSFVILLICISFIWSSTILNIKYEKYISNILIVTFFLAIILVASLYVPNESDDSYRYFCYMKSMQNQMFADIQKESPYKTEFVFNYIMYFVANYTSYNGFLQIIVLCMGFLALTKIIQYCFESVIDRYFSAYFLILMSTVLLYFLISGLRSFSAAMLFAYSVVLIEISNRKHKKILSFIVFITAVGMHNMVIVAGVVYVLSKLAGKNMLCFLKFIMVLWGLSCNMIINVMNFTGIDILKHIAYKMDRYINIIDVNIDIRFYMVQVIVLILVTIIAYSLPNEKNKKYIQLMVLFNWGALFNYTFFERILRMNIFLIAIPLFDLKKRNVNIYYVSVIAFIISIPMIMYQIVMIYHNMRFNI